MAEENVAGLEYGWEFHFILGVEGLELFFILGDLFVDKGELFGC